MYLVTVMRIISFVARLRQNTNEMCGKQKPIYAYKLEIQSNQQALPSPCSVHGGQVNIL